MRRGATPTTNGPVTVMVCSFEETNAGVVRLYGHAKVAQLDDYPYRDKLLSNEAESIHLPMRQVIEIEVDSTITSCGYGVPVMQFKKERTIKERGRRYKDS